MEIRGSKKIVNKKPLMGNLSESNNNKTKHINILICIVVLAFILLFVVGFYFTNFQYLPERNEVWWSFFQFLSEKNEDWGTFGDYFGGILNPVIAAFAFYLIAETYKLQNVLLQESRDAQYKQIKLAALTASLNSNLTNISILQSDKSSLLNEFCGSSSGDKELASRVKVLWSESSYSCLPDDDYFEKYQAEMAAGQAEYESLIEQIKADKGDYFVLIIKRFIEIDVEIKDLINENGKLKAKIGAFLKLKEPLMD